MNESMKESINFVDPQEMDLDINWAQFMKLI